MPLFPCRQIDYLDDLVGSAEGEQVAVGADGGAELAASVPFGMPVLAEHGGQFGRRLVLVPAAGLLEQFVTV